jgi:hypothetical protein
MYQSYIKSIYVYFKYKVKAHYGDSLWGTFGSNIIIHTI